MKNAKQSIKKGKGGLESNKTNKDFYDDAGSGYNGYDEEYGNDYGNYYDDNSASAKEGLGMFRSANKGNHLPSINFFFVMFVFKPLAFSRIFSKGVPRSGRDG